MVVLINNIESMYFSSIARKDFYKVIDRVSNIYNSINKINDYTITIRNYTSESCVELVYDLAK